MGKLNIRFYLLAETFAKIKIPVDFYKTFLSIWVRLGKFCVFFHSLASSGDKFPPVLCPDGFPRALETRYVLSVQSIEARVVSQKRPIKDDSANGSS